VVTVPIPSTMSTRPSTEPTTTQISTTGIYTVNSTVSDKTLSYRNQTHNKSVSNMLTAREYFLDGLVFNSLKSAANKTLDHDKNLNHSYREQKNGNFKSDHIMHNFSSFLLFRNALSTTPNAKLMLIPDEKIYSLLNLTAFYKFNNSFKLMPATMNRTKLGQSILTTHFPSVSTDLRVSKTLSKIAQFVGPTMASTTTPIATTELIVAEQTTAPPLTTKTTTVLTITTSEPDLEDTLVYNGKNTQPWQPKIMHRLFFSSTLNSTSRFAIVTNNLATRSSKSINVDLTSTTTTTMSTTTATTTTTLTTTMTTTTISTTTSTSTTMTATSAQEIPLGWTQSNLGGHSSSTKQPNNVYYAHTYFPDKIVDRATSFKLTLSTPAPEPMDSKLSSFFFLNEVIKNFTRKPPSNANVFLIADQTTTNQYDFNNYNKMNVMNVNNGRLAYPNGDKQLTLNDDHTRGRHHSPDVDSGFISRINGNYYFTNTHVFCPSLASSNI
jgi:hypothetical protein